MTLWLVDASVLLACDDTDDANHADAGRLLTGAHSVVTLDLALYEATNVAIAAWHDRAGARRLAGLVAAVEGDGGIVRADRALLEAAADLALAHGLSAYDAAYVAAADAIGGELVSCDIKDLVARNLAKTPADALAS